MNQALPNNPIQSPCIGLCKLNADNVCTGCFRTLGEIENWAGADETARRAILDRVAERKAEDRPA